MSALSLKADIHGLDHDVCFVPKADIDRPKDSGLSLAYCRMR